MYFLVLQEEMTADAEAFTGQTALNTSNASQPRTTNFFPSLLPENEIQKVIFDTNYLNYL